VETKDETSDRFTADLLEQIDRSFSTSLPLLSSAQVQQLSPAALAYIGDAVYELYVRLSYLMPPKRLQAYHSQVVGQVRAESQASHLRSLKPHLTADELEISKRGRNAASNRPRKVALEIYQGATSLETLMGYLYLTDPQRLAQLLAKLNLKVLSEKSI
jgi:ribonuclease-3 family protein